MAVSQKYSVDLLTGDVMGLPTDLRIDFTLIGEDDQTDGPFSFGAIEIGGRTVAELHRANRNEPYEFDGSKDIGELLAIKVTASTGWRMVLSELFVQTIRVRQLNRAIHVLFPIYSWIQSGDERYFFGGPATIQNDPSISESMSLLRVTDLAYQCSLYDAAKFARIPGVPVGMSMTYLNLPRDERYDQTKFFEIVHSIGRKYVDLLKIPITEQYASWKSFQEISDSLFNDKEPLLPEVAKTWQTDETFGRQYLRGINNCTVQLCKKALPEEFQGETLLSRVAVLQGKNIQQEVDLGKFCFVDYRPQLEDIVKIQKIRREKDPSKQSYYLCAPICLFYYDERLNTIIPVAIQLKRNGKIYLPTANDDAEFDRNEWILAKMFFHSADAQVHQIGTHLTRTHLVSEAFALAIRRSFSPWHPLFRMLKPHLLTVMAMNTLARSVLIPQIAALFSIGEDWSALAQKSFKGWSINICSPMGALEENGIGIGAKTPLADVEGAYPWREDAILIWDAIYAYSLEYVTAYYAPSGEKLFGAKTSDALVKGDNELSHFRLELFALLPGKEIPEFTTIKSVADIVARIIWVSSAGHAGVNFMQYEYYGYQPNHPVSMRIPIPEELDTTMITTKMLMSAIPDISSTVRAMEIARTLSTYSHEEVFLGKSSQNLLHADAKARRVVEMFNTQLDEITAIIKKRNKTSRKGQPYVWLMPDMITNSIVT